MRKKGASENSFPRQALSSSVEIWVKYRYIHGISARVNIDSAFVPPPPLLFEISNWRNKGRGFSCRIIVNERLKNIYIFLFPAIHYYYHTISSFDLFSSFDR